MGRGVNVSYLLSLRYYNTQNPTHVNIQTCWTGNIAEENLLTEQSPINIISSIIARCAMYIYIISLYFIFAQELYLTHVLSN